MQSDQEEENNQVNLVSTLKGFETLSIDSQQKKQGLLNEKDHIYLKKIIGQLISDKNLPAYLENLQKLKDYYSICIISELVQIIIEQNKLKNYIFDPQYIEKTQKQISSLYPNIPKNYTNRKEQKKKRDNQKEQQNSEIKEITFERIFEFIAFVKFSFIDLVERKKIYICEQAYQKFFQSSRQLYLEHIEMINLFLNPYEQASIQLYLFKYKSKANEIIEQEYEKSKQNNWLEYRFHIALFLAFDKKFQDSYDVLQDLIDHCERENNNINLYKPYFRAGSLLTDLKNYEKSISYYEKSLQFKPNESNTYFNYGISLSRLKKHDQCIKIYNKCITIDPLDYDAYENLAYEYYDMGQYEKAIEITQDLLKKDPSNADAYVMWGNILCNQMLLYDAKKKYEMALEIEPEHSLAYSNLGILFLDGSNHNKAYDYFCKAQKYGPEESINYFYQSFCAYEQEKKRLAAQHLYEGFLVDKELLLSEDISIYDELPECILKQSSKLYNIEQNRKESENRVRYQIKCLKKSILNVKYFRKDIIQEVSEYLTSSSKSKQQIKSLPKSENKE